MTATTTTYRWLISVTWEENQRPWKGADPTPYLFARTEAMVNIDGYTMEDHHAKQRAVKILEAVAADRALAFNPHVNIRKEFARVADTDGELDVNEARWVLADGQDEAQIDPDEVARAWAAATRAGGNSPTPF